VITDHNSILFCGILSEKCKNAIHSVKIGGKLELFFKESCFPDTVKSRRVSE